MKYKSLTTSVLLLLFGSGETLAKVSTQEANQLGNNLTVVGAEKSANETGIIPRYIGGLQENTDVDPLKDIYANETPLFIITSKNLSKYEKQLSDGQKALFIKYPGTYKMPVYKTHRTSRYPQSIINKAQSNAISSELLVDGNGIINFDESIPFALPKSGLEVIWNHVSRYRGGSIERNSAQIPVQRDGSYTAVRVRSQLTAPQYLKEGFSEKDDANILFYFTQAIKSPARLTGNVLLVHETIDQVKQPRKAWSYNAGQRRVRRAPQVAYDAPSAASDGLRTSDQIDMFNGAPDKYNWQLMGKQEMYIPYNSYKLANPNTSYDDIVQAGHINQDLTRYELHRVWKIEATLKENARHIYGKRTFYIDEDSWQIAIADHYDNRGELWRASEGHALQFVNANTPWYVSTTTYDLFSGRYLVELNNEEKDPFKFGKEMKRKSFTASAIRRQGRR